MLVLLVISFSAYSNTVEGFTKEELKVWETYSGYWWDEDYTKVKTQSGNELKMIATAKNNGQLEKGSKITITLKKVADKFQKKEVIVNTKNQITYSKEDMFNSINQLTPEEFSIKEELDFDESEKNYLFMLSESEWVNFKNKNDFWSNTEKDRLITFSVEKEFNNYKTDDQITYKIIKTSEGYKKQVKINGVLNKEVITKSSLEELFTEKELGKRKDKLAIVEVYDASSNSYIEKEAFEVFNTKGTMTYLKNSNGSYGNLMKERINETEREIFINYTYDDKNILTEIAKTYEHKNGYREKEERYSVINGEIGNLTYENIYETDRNIGISYTYDEKNLLVETSKTYEHKDGYREKEERYKIINGKEILETQWINANAGEDNNMTYTSYSFDEKGNYKEKFVEFGPQNTEGRKTGERDNYKFVSGNWKKVK